MAQTKVPKPFAKVFAGAHRIVYELSGGRIGAKVGGGTIGLLTTTGRKSGKTRTTPLTVLEHGDGWAVTASFSGHDTHPDWYLNLQADPMATLKLGSVEHAVRARDAEGAERTELWDRLVAAYSGYAEYQKVTDRVIPVIALDPA